MTLLDEPVLIDLSGVEMDPTERLVQAIEKLDERLRASDARWDERLREMQGEMNHQFSSMSDRYMPRAELNNLLQIADQRRVDDRVAIERLQTVLDATEQRRRVEVRWALGFAATVATFFLALLAFVVQNLPPAVPTP